MIIKSFMFHGSSQLFFPPFSIHFLILITWYAHSFAVPLFCFIIFLIVYFLLLSFHLRALLKMLCSNISKNDCWTYIGISISLFIHLLPVGCSLLVFTRKRRKKQKPGPPTKSIEDNREKESISSGHDIFLKIITILNLVTVCIHISVAFVRALFNIILYSCVSIQRSHCNRKKNFNIPFSIQ